MNPPVYAAQPSISFTGVQSVVSIGAISAKPLNSPSGLAMSTDGTLYIADTGNNRIIRLTSSGSATVLGVGTLNAPNAVAIDFGKNLYIADTLNSRILKVTAGGSVSTVSTSPLILSAPSGLATDSAGNLFIADTNNNRIVEVTTSGSAQLLTTGTLSLSHPQGMAVDSSGNLFIADTNNSRVVEVTVSGSAQAINLGALSVIHPIGLAIDKQGDLFVSDASNNQVIELNPDGESFVLGASGLSLSGPANLAADSSGDLYIADTNNNRIVTLQLNIADLGAVPIGQTTSVSLNFTVNSTLTLGNIQVLTQGATPGDFADVDSGTCKASQTYNANQTCTLNLSFIPSVAGLRAGAVVISDTGGNVLETTFLRGIGQGPQVAFAPVTSSALNVGSLLLNKPSHVVMDGAGNIFIADTSNNRIIKLTPQGNASVLNTGSIALGSVTGIAMDAAGNLYIADATNSQIVEVTPQAAASVLSIAGPGLLFPNPFSPHGLAINGAGGLYIADTNNNRVLHTALDGVTSVLTTTGLSLNAPADVAVDGPGNIYIADAGNNRIVKVSPSASVTVIGTGTITLNTPQGVTLDPSGTVYISDTNNNRIVRVTPQGIASSVSTGSFTLTGPVGIDSDILGNLYISDTDNNRVVKLNRAAVPSLSFLNANIGVASSDSPQTVTVENIGNQALNFSGIALDTGDTNFSLLNTGTNLCSASTSLNPGNNCDVSTSFAPTTTGSLSGNVTLTNNALNLAPAQQVIMLSGTGLDVEKGFSISGPAIVYVGSTGNSYVVTALDASNATDIGFNGSLTVNITGAATLSTSVSLTNGVGTFSLPVLSVVGTYTLTVTSPNASGFLAITAEMAPENLSWSTPAPITYGTALSSAQLNATATGAAGISIPGTFVYTPAAGTIPDAGTQTLSVTFTPTDTAQYTTKTTTVSLTVNQAPSTVTMASSAASVTAGKNVTFTATVSSSAGIPTGSVSFLDATTVLGTSTVDAQGVATYSTSALSVGTHSITANYTGDNNFAVSASAPFTQTIVAPVAPDYSLGINPTTLTIKQGLTGTATLTITPVGGFTGTFSFSCSGLPAYSTCTFKPTTSTADGSDTPVTTTLTITTNTSATAAIGKPASPFGGAPILPAAIFWIPGGMLGGFTLLRRKKLSLKGMQLFVMLALLAFTVGLAACGSAGSGSTTSTSSTTTPVGTSNAVITVSTGSSTSTTSHTVALTVVITN
ncbi:MAG: virginiamycin B lyase family protein [Acidobacteriaceae bacterium]